MEKQLYRFRTCSKAFYPTFQLTVCDTNEILIAEAGSSFYAQTMTFRDLEKMPDFRSNRQNSAIPLLVVKGQCDN